MSLLGGLGNDVLAGDEGDDTFVLYGSEGTDSYDGGTGTDTIVLSGASAYSYVEIGINILESVENIINTTTNDTYLKISGSLDLTGINLVDIAGVRGSAGTDYLTGAPVYDSSTSTWSGIYMTSDSGNDELTGSTYGDVLDGGNDVDTLYGKSGNDSLYGGAGGDFLFGDAGNDSLTGGPGSDYFWFESGGGVDTITDFTVGTDTIVVGSSLTNVDLYHYNGTASTLVEFDGGASYAILVNVNPTTLTGSDFYFA